MTSSTSIAFTNTGFNRLEGWLAETTSDVATSDRDDDDVRLSDDVTVAFREESVRSERAIAAAAETGDAGCTRAACSG